ncbi:MAG: hypothetical protein EA391_11335 [Balneolaceae bacterium]|nr:MAG: hypothetical protein EA391_11335 [Balneolaceae bacterium]
MIAQTFSPLQKKKNLLCNRRKTETGFPSPATDHLEERLNLHDHLVKYPSSTFFVKFEGEDATSLGLNDGDMLIVDRSIAPKLNSLVIAEVDGENIVCRVVRDKAVWALQKSNGVVIPLITEIPGESPVWGKVTHIIHAV